MGNLLPPLLGELHPNLPVGELQDPIRYRLAHNVLDQQAASSHLGHFALVRATITAGPRLDLDWD